MLRKVYLTKTLPQDSLISQTLPDVKQLMDTYREGKNDFMNEAPEIHPQPLEKYEGRKTKIEVTSNERSNAIENLHDDDAYSDVEEDDVDADTYDDMIMSLPQHVRIRAGKLLPFVLKTNYGNLRLRELMYDLTVPNVKKILSKDRSMLESVYRQLSKMPNLKRQYYVNKLSPTPMKSSSQSPRVSAHPRKSMKPVLATPMKRHSASRISWT